MFRSTIYCPDFLVPGNVNAQTNWTDIREGEAWNISLWKLVKVRSDEYSLETRSLENIILQTSAMDGHVAVVLALPF